MVENQFKNEFEVQGLLNLIAEARKMVEAGQGDTPISIGNVRFTAGGLVEAADHIHSPTPSGSSWERFLSTLITSFNSVARRLSLVTVILFSLALLIFVVYLNTKLNQPHPLSTSAPAGQTLRPSEKALVENLMDSAELNGTSTMIAEHLAGGSCPSTGFWRNNKGTFLLVCFTNADYPGALKWVDGEYLDGGVFSVETLLEFVNDHDLVKIHGGEQ